MRHETCWLTFASYFLFLFLLILFSYKKDDTSSVKKVVVEASSEEELIEKIKNVDWNKVSGEKVGARFDFSV